MPFSIVNRAWWVFNTFFQFQERVMTVSFPHVVKPFCFQFASHASLCYNFVAFDVTGGLKESLKHLSPFKRIRITIWLICISPADSNWAAYKHNGNCLRFLSVKYISLPFYLISVITLSLCQYSGGRMVVIFHLFQPCLNWAIIMVSWVLRFRSTCFCKL